MSNLQKDKLRGRRIARCMGNQSNSEGDCSKEVHGAPQQLLASLNAVLPHCTQSRILMMTCRFEDRLAARGHKEKGGMLVVFTCGSYLWRGTNVTRRNALN